MQSNVIGASLPRKEDDPLLRGTALFADDIVDVDTLHAHVLRSPTAHARIVSLDVSAASEAPGVHLVLTAADLPVGQEPIPTRMFPDPSLDPYLQPPLAGSVVRYSGEPVAVLVAESRYAAEDAGELVDLELEPLDAVLRLGDAAGQGAPLVHESTASNVAASFTIEWGDMEAAMRDAACIVEEQFELGRHGAVPLEGRGVVAQIGTDGNLTVFGAAKIPHVNRRILARLLDWPEDRVRFVELHVGGGFGARGEFYPEDFLIPFCAIRLGRPWPGPRTARSTCERPITRASNYTK